MYESWKDLYITPFFVLLLQPAGGLYFSMPWAVAVEAISNDL